MAGAFTHMTVVNGAISSFAPNQRIGKILRKWRNFLILGSVSPDIPYLAYLAMGGFNWANIMHYHQTNGILKNGLYSLHIRDENVKLGETWECQLAWLLGFAGHLVTDATIHPIVDKLVGPYSDSDSHTNHRLCEMTQDIMIVKEVENIDLANAHYTEILKTCFSNNFYKKVCEFWTAHLNVNFPIDESFSAEKIVDSYYELLKTATGDDALSKAFRYFGIDFIYHSYDDLVKNHPDYVEKYYKKIFLPNGTRGNFKENGYSYAVKNLVVIWSKIDRFLFTTDNINEIVPNWNLDNGIDQSTGLQTYWS